MTTTGAQYPPYRVMQLLLHWPLYLRDGDRPRPRAIIGGRRQRSYEAGFVAAAIEYGDLGHAIAQLDPDAQQLVFLYWRDLWTLWEIGRQLHRRDQQLRHEVQTATQAILDFMSAVEDAEAYLRAWRERPQSRRYRR